MLLPYYYVVLHDVIRDSEIQSDKYLKLTGYCYTVIYRMHVYAFIS